MPTKLISGAQESKKFRLSRRSAACRGRSVSADGFLLVFAE